MSESGESTSKNYDTVTVSNTELHTVMVACECPDTASTIVERLSDSGFSILGPVDRASLAMALAAQTPVSIAVVGTGLAGRRGGRELAIDLMNTWGAGSILIDGEAGPGDWEASGDLAGRVREVVASIRATDKTC